MRYIEYSSCYILTIILYSIFYILSHTRLAKGLRYFVSTVQQAHTHVSCGDSCFTLASIATRKKLICQYSNKSIICPPRGVQYNHNYNQGH